MLRHLDIFVTALYIFPTSLAGGIVVFLFWRRLDTL